PAGHRTSRPGPSVPDTGVRRLIPSSSPHPPAGPEDPPDSKTKPSEPAKARRASDVLIHHKVGLILASLNTPPHVNNLLQRLSSPPPGAAEASGPADAQARKPHTPSRTLQAGCLANCTGAAPLSSGP